MLNIKNLKKNVVLSPYTTYKIGGPAKYFVVVRTKQELIDCINEARSKEIPYFLLGLGANILISDKGFNGLVIKNETNSFSLKDSILTAESGTTISDLIEFTKNENLSGLEHFSGIPSTVGGAIWQNLHFLTPDRKDTYYIESIIDSVEILNTDGSLSVVDKNYFKFGYDYSILHDEEIIVTEARLKLKKLEKEKIQKQIDENIKWRNEKQPQLVDFPSCGSVFKKIEGVGAGRLIEKSGLKGYRVGGIQVSEKHANYLVNTGNATASDVVKLIKTIQDKVLEETGYKLETEIKMIGEF
jgi:UDP-N-acetylmuramate dehydrogenase